jgi:hypothetical protein
MQTSLSHHVVSSCLFYLCFSHSMIVWSGAPQALDKASSLDELINSHNAFLADLDAQSGRAAGAASLGPGPAAGSWRHLVNAIVRIMDQVCFLALCCGSF